MQRWRTTDWQLFEPRTFEAGRLRKLHGYLGNVSHVDHAVGEFLQFLEDAGLADDTIVVYSSDYGDYAAEFGIMEKAPGICSDATRRECSPASAPSGGSAASRSCTTWRPTPGSRKTSPCCRNTAPRSRNCVVS